MKAQRSHRKTSGRRPRRLALEALEPRQVLSLSVPPLISLPGANHTIYLDFDGQRTAGAWNQGGATIEWPAYNTDTDNTNFNGAELADIRNAWKRVAEDYAPFNVNVTTVEPALADLIKSKGSGDTRWGVRVLITRDVALDCGCGGMAQIDSFNADNDTPVFVFNTGEIGVGEAASHEAGHALGLSHDGTTVSPANAYYWGHDGTGQTPSWAPIMGVGYMREVSQWDKGEYFGSNNSSRSANYGKGPDDLKVITTYNGFTYRTDDNLNSKPLTMSGNAVSGSGVIERNTDVDVFTFTTSAGWVNLNVSPAAVGANLDIRAVLKNASGTLVASANPPTALNASFSLYLPAGPYSLEIDGVGAGAPTANPPTGYTDYASLGQYSISGILAPASGDALSILATDVSKPEGNSGTTAFTFTVYRSGSVAGTSTVNYGVSGPVAAGADASDFVGNALPGGTLTFSPDVTSQTITIPVQGDTTQESDEGFIVTLTSPSADTVLATNSAAGTILNDEFLPVLSIAGKNSSKNEGTGTTTPFTFWISRSGDSSGTSSVVYTVSPTGASPADQYDFPGNAFPTGVIQFYPGVTSAELTINVVGDSMKESNETFRVTLSNPSNATIGRATANGTITNDDGSGKGAAAAASEAIAAMETDAGQPAIVVADPLWFFVPPELLTPEQLAVPVITWINGVRHVGDLADEFDHGRELRGDHFGGEASPGMDAAAAGLMMARRADCGSVGAPHVVAPAAPDVAALASSSMPLPTPGPAVSSDDSLTDLLAKLRSRRSRKEIEGWQEAIDSVLAAWDA